MGERLLTPKEAAAYLGLSISWLTKWRTRGQGPAFIKFDDSPRGHVRYREADLLRFVEARTNTWAQDARREVRP
jgi:hypothetical protein